MLKIVDTIEHTWNLWEKMGMELQDMTKTIMDIKVSGKSH